jgi:hypothetical protein
LFIKLKSTDEEINRISAPLGAERWSIASINKSDHLKEVEYDGNALRGLYIKFTAHPHIKALAQSITLGNFTIRGTNFF